MAVGSTLGVGSTLDVNSLVTQLMTAEQQPLTNLAKKEARYQAQLSAYGSLKGALSTFQNSVATLASATNFSTIVARPTDTTITSASAFSTAMAGNYSINVTQLAQSQKLQSNNGFATSNATLGTGTLTISFGTYTTNTATPPVTSFELNKDRATKTITIGTGQGSLSGVRDAINAANVGISANIVNDGNALGNHLVITSTNTGIANALRIAVADTSDSSDTDSLGLSQLAYDSTTQNMAVPLGMEAKNALLSIDGIAIKKSSNPITDAITGVTLNLLKVGTTSMTVARDTSAIGSSLQSFVNSYNNIKKTITDLSQYNLASKTASTLTGDSAINSLTSQLRGVFNAALTTAGGGLKTLSDIGITFQKDGTLALNTNKMNTILNDSTKDVSTLFAAVGKPQDSLIKFNSSTTDTKNGIYAINVSRLASQGNVTGGATGAPAGVFTISDTNNSLNLNIDGVTASIKLANGTYTKASDLAAEVQSKINGVSALSSSNISVAVTSTGGALNVTSNRYGSGSTIENISGTASSTIFGTVNYANNTGHDVAGSIGNLAATGSGQTLIGSGNAKNLSIDVNGGITGSRGSVNFARGYAYELKNLVGNILSSNNLIDSRVSGINTSIKGISNQRDQVSLHLAAIEARYRKQFTALDVMLSGMKQTSSYLTQQLANLPTLNNV